LAAVFTLYRHLFPTLAPKGEGKGKRAVSPLGPLARASLS